MPRTLPLWSACRIHHRPLAGHACYATAVHELQRLLGRLGTAVELVEVPARGRGWSLAVTTGNGRPGTVPVPAGLRHDGYLLAIAAGGAVLAGREEKSVLNAVYDLAERAGVRFVLPGEAGELLPDGPASLPVGRWLRNPVLPRRGVFWQTVSCADYTAAEWLRFYAKLRFNTVAHDLADLPLARELGLRLEIGGHGLSHLLPRERFAAEPDLFRMFQPEDFGGKRMPDANFCVTNPRTRAAIAETFTRQLAEAGGVHAIHAWADDLPAGGWCLCPSCRSFQPSDQALLATRILTDAARAAGSPVRIPMLAYHDTMAPGGQVDPPAGSVLLFAPRERCYGHALGDPACARNRRYRADLAAWTRAYRGIGDAHSFEYYFDQILFRGLYPYLPDIIFADQATYRDAGIETHLSLQVAGPAIAPEHNMLAFAWAGWEERPTAARFAAWLADGVHPAWAGLLADRACIFQDALRICDHEPNIYLDYRWLPETTRPFGAGMARTYARASRALAAAAARFRRAVRGARPAVARLAGQELARAGFESAELAAMGHQQAAVNGLALWHARGSRPALARSLAAFARASAALETAEARAIAAGIDEQTWYVKNIARWLRREFAAKAERYGPCLVHPDNN